MGVCVGSTVGASVGAGGVVGCAGADVAAGRVGAACCAGAAIDDAGMSPPHATRRGGHSLMFATVFGGLISHAVALKYFCRALDWAELPADYRFHDPWHTAATLMIANGVDSRTVAAILGHSRNSTPLDIYAHAVPSNHNRAVDAIQRALRRDP